MKKIVIIGAGGFGREVAWLIKRINLNKPTWNLVGFIDGNKELYGKEVGGIPVVGGMEYLDNIQEDIYVICSIGTPNTRKKVINQIPQSDYVKVATLIDPAVNVLLDEVEIGEGTIVCANTTLTTNIKIGKHVIINLHCSVGHDTEIGDYTVICPNAAVGGGVKIGEEAFFGNSCSLRDEIVVGENTIVGMGSLVTKKLPNNVVAYGNPAKPVKENINYEVYKRRG